MKGCRTSVVALWVLSLLALTTAAKAGEISYSVNVVDVQAPSPFGFDFGTPITPISGLADYSFSSSITLTDGGADGVSAAINVLPEFFQLGVSDSMPTLTVVDDVGGSASLVGAGTYNFSASGTFDCSTFPSGCDFLRLKFSFSLSGGNDELQSSGIFDFSARQSVSEPTAIALLGIALAGLGFNRRKFIQKEQLRA